MDVLVMAKEPVPGRVKTRLSPALSPDEAATVAAACLADTLEAALGSGADRVVVALDGAPGPWCPPGVCIIAQGTGSFDRRLSAAWAAVGRPAVQIGMDTPQLTPGDLDSAMATLSLPGTDAVLGDATDGGWWLIGLHSADHRVFDGVPMSRHDTGRRQRDRLAHLGLAVRDARVHRDIDTVEDALAVAAEAPGTRLAAAMQEFAYRFG